ncbi:MAG: AcrR family transcriptional regulator [Planctomycetota bacterium]|jgi:AcrR family transcriptional regulator
MNAESAFTAKLDRSISSERSKGRPRDAHTHQVILETTRRLAAEKDSYSEISIEAISRGAHVAKTTIYRWWKNKNALVSEACFAGRVVAPFTGSLREDIRDLISQEAAMHQGPVTRGVLAGYTTDFIERCSKVGVEEEAPKRLLESALDDILEDARLRGEDLDHLDARHVTNHIEMVLFYQCVFRGQEFTPDMANELLNQILPAA